ncbi:MAG: cytochrome-c peroxidase [Bacteroidota bacterium]|jgi:cytochrome c peroxidase
MGKLSIYIGCLILILTASCKVDSKFDPIINEDDITVKWPDYFPAPVYDFSGNPITKEGFLLGKKLFYDPILSVDNTISCGSCHQQFVAFAHADHKLSHGIDNKLGVRNSQALFNMIWNTTFFWDGGSKHIEVQPIGPITNPVEMDETVQNVVYKLSQRADYKSLFKAAFNTDSITSQLMLKAIAQFMGAFVSASSKYDKNRIDPIANPFTEDEKLGQTIFESKCASCHVPPLFTDNSFRNNGLDEIFSDSGRYLITNINSDMGKFKVPSLRNIELTYPYMHDGRFETLPQVLNHYSSEIKQSSTLDQSLTNGIALNNTEKQQLIAFLKTLTDREFINDPRFKEAN